MNVDEKALAPSMEKKEFTAGKRIEINLFLLSSFIVSASQYSLITKHHISLNISCSEPKKINVINIPV